jgi:predicted DNA-binding protein (UPF0251 family)
LDDTGNGQGRSRGTVHDDYTENREKLAENSVQNRKIAHHGRD